MRARFSHVWIGTYLGGSIYIYIYIYIRKDCGGGFGHLWLPYLELHYKKDKDIKKKVRGLFSSNIIYYIIIELINYKKI